MVSVATTSWVVSEALSSKISAVVLFPENISSACKIEYARTFIKIKIKSNVQTYRHDLIKIRCVCMSVMFCSKHCIEFCSIDIPT